MKKSAIVNRFIQIALFLISLLLFVNLIRSWVSLRDRGDIIQEAKERLEEEKKLQEELKRKLAQVEGRQFIEKQVREKLNLGRKGEIVVIIPSISPLASPTPTPPDLDSNWQKWVRIFL